MMRKTKQNFKDTMYDYGNINEYYSFYGNVVYISTEYLKGNDYFIILKKNNAFALVEISNDEMARFEDFENRDNLIEELEKLESTLQFVEGFNNFLQRVQLYLSHTKLSAAAKAELIRLKTVSFVLWNYIQIENLVNLHRKNKTETTKEFRNEYRQVGYDQYASTTYGAGLYNTPFNITSEWVSGNDFFDFTFYHFSYKIKKRINVFDLAELSSVIEAIAGNDDQKALRAVTNCFT
jgi:hypothetical protein